MKKILILRPDGIGDFVIFTAVLEEYRRIFPDAKIDILCRPVLKDLVDVIPIIDRKIYVEGRNILQKKYFLHRIFLKLKLFFFKYDILIYPVYSRNIFGDMIAHWVRADEKIVFDGDSANDLDNERMDRNKYFSCIIRSETSLLMEIERNMEFVNHLGGQLSKEDLRTRLWFKNSDQIKCNSILQKNGLNDRNYICIFPGSGYSIKCWETNSWVDFLERFSSRWPLIKVVFLGGPDDEVVNKTIIERLGGKGKIVDLTRKVDLRVLAKVIEQSKLLVSMDTAAIHIAAAVRTPNICIIGGWNFGRFYPYGDLSMNRIVNKQMDCYGCNWKCCHSYIKCIFDIKCEDVLKEVQKIL